MHYRMPLPRISNISLIGLLLISVCIRRMLYTHSLKNCLELLGENPNMGSRADDIRPGYRRFTHESHVVFYRDTGRGVLIVRVLHKRMDINQHIDE